MTSVTPCTLVHRQDAAQSCKVCECQKGVGWRAGIAPTILMDVSHHFHNKAALIPGKRPWYQFKKRVG